jgi:cytochrome c nitrite reductase small subunit
LINPISLRAISSQSIQNEGDGYCWDCHRETPHGRVNSLTSTPYARVPQLSSPIPSWIEETLGLTNSK